MSKTQRMPMAVLLSSILLVMTASARAASENSDEQSYSASLSLYPDSLAGRVYNNDASKSSLSVPFVTEDTSNHGKKFWIGPAVALSDTMIHHRYVGIEGNFRRLVVSYCDMVAGHNELFTRNSWTFGNSFDQPAFVYDLDGGAGPGSIQIGDDGQIIAFEVFGEHSGEWAIRSRRTASGAGSYQPAVTIQETDDSEPRGYTPIVRVLLDTLYAAFLNFDQENYIRMAKSSDVGSTWELLFMQQGPIRGQPFSFIVNDTVLACIYPTVTWLEAGIVRSYDRGQTWSPQEFISSDSFIASQLPVGCGNGVSSLHATWYDFEGAPPGWAGWTLYRRSVDNGQTWEPVQCMSTVAATEQVEIAADGNHTYCVWVDGRFISPNLALYMRHSWDDGATWSPEIKIVSEIDPAWDPDVYADGDVFYVVWREQHPPDWIWRVCFKKGGWYLPGDVDHSDGLDIADLTFLVNYMFKDGLPPKLESSLEMDGKGGINIADLTYFVDYMFREGPSPKGE